MLKNFILKSQLFSVFYPLPTKETVICIVLIEYSFWTKRSLFITKTFYNTCNLLCVLWCPGKVRREKRSRKKTIVLNKINEKNSKKKSWLALSTQLCDTYTFSSISKKKKEIYIYVPRENKRERQYGFARRKPCPESHVYSHFLLENW